MTDENKLIAERKKKLENIKQKHPLYPNRFKKKSSANDLTKNYSKLSKDNLAKKKVKTTIAGRVLTIRDMGNSSFANLHDESGNIQIYLQKKFVGEEQYELFNNLDLGDIIGVDGELFKTKTDELTLNVENIVLLSKSLRPLPEKFHGISDIEIKYRQRYLDLMINMDTKNILKKKIGRASCRERV